MPLKSGIDLYAQDFFGYLGPFKIPYEFWVIFLYLKNAKFALFAQDIFDYLDSFYFHMNIWIVFSISLKKVIGVLVGIALNCIYHFLSYGCFNLYSIDP
jgi:hypothetical protein